MNFLFTIILAILVFLAVSSGIVKIMLMPQDVEFFTRYGFTRLGIQLYGATQILGGVLLIIPKVRFYGAIVVALTFIAVLVLLILDGKYGVSAVTTIATLLLIHIAIRSRETAFASHS